MTIKHIFHILYTFKTTKQLVDERIAKLVEENLEVIVWREMKIKHFFFKTYYIRKKKSIIKLLKSRINVDINIFCLRNQTVQKTEESEEKIKNCNTTKRIKKGQTLYFDLTYQLTTIKINIFKSLV